MPLPEFSPAQVRAALLARQEIALLDVREEDPHAQAHPLFAANFPRARIELEAWAKLPRRDVTIVLVDNDGIHTGEAERAGEQLRAIGYDSVFRLTGGIAGWRAAGGELFRDVNVPSKAFGELVESERHTPMLSAQELKILIDGGADLVVVDARRFDEFRTMSIPTATSVPGAELLLRVPELAPQPQTRVVVNCAGRTRSIIGAQSLINAGLPNPVSALRNGTIGWTLAGQSLEHGQTRQAPQASPASREHSSARARTLADRAGVRRTNLAACGPWRNQEGRTTYFFDVRDHDEFLAGHVPGFRPVSGGQLVQETEMVAPVRGARIVLVDDDGVRANMCASWLAQMAWEVHVIDGLNATDFHETGPWSAPLPPLPEPAELRPGDLARQLNGNTLVLDFAASASYRRAHIPGAWWLLRSDLEGALTRIPRRRSVVVSSEDGLLARIVAADVSRFVGGEVFALAGGNQAWVAAGLASESGDSRLASAPIDRYRRPYEGTDASIEAMQAYLDWEYGLVAQLARDGTHGFRVF